MNFWKRMFAVKQSEARTALVINQVGRPQPGPKNYLAFSREGYQTNPIAYQCVAKISRAVSRIPLVLYKKVNGRKVKIDEHPILKLFANPNPLQGGVAFMEAVTAYFALSGNTYIEKFMGPGNSNEPSQLWPVRPDVVKIYAGPKGLPLKYEVGLTGGVKVFPVDQVYGLSLLTHIKTFHPTDLWIGMSPMEAAVYSLDQHNESAKWNLAMLMNMGTPSGAFAVKQDASTNPMGVLPEPQFNRLQEQIRSQLKGSQNAGRVMVLEGGVDWKQFGHNAKEMDWLEGRSLNAREIAGVYGVPTMLVNIPGDSTFANYKEARFSFYEDTVVPTLEYLLADIHRSIIWPAWGQDYCLEPDLDRVDALNIRRAEKAEQAEKASYLTVNEKREMVGKEPRPEGDVILVGSGQQSLESLIASGEEPAPEDVPQGANSAQTPPEEEAPGEDENPEPNGEETPEAVSKATQHTQQRTSDPLKLKTRGVSRETFEEVTLLELSVKANQVNVTTAKGKRRTWTEVNRARKRFQSPMYMDIKEALDEQATALGKELSGVPNALWDLTAINAINKGEEELKGIYRRHMRRALKAFAQPVLEAGKAADDFETKTLVKFNRFVDKFVDEHSAKNVTEILGTSKKIARAKIRDALKEGLAEGTSEQAIVDTIVDSLKNVTESRARMIARTEIGMASSNGAIEAAKSLDVPDLEKEWVSDQRPFADLRDGGVTGDKPDHVAMDGARVGLDEKFSVPPDAEMDGPHDPSAGPEHVINCQCVVIFSRAKKE